MPLPWHLEVYISKLVLASWSIIICHFVDFFWIIHKIWRIHSAASKLKARNRISSIRYCYLACLGSFWTSLGFCSAYLFGTVHPNLWNDWLGRSEWSDTFRKPNRFVIFRTTWCSNHLHQFISTLDCWRLDGRSSEMKSWIWRSDWLLLNLRWVRVVLLFDVLPKVLRHLLSYY